MGSGCITVRLGALKERWHAHCTDRGVVPSEALRQVLANFLGHGDGELVKRHLPPSEQRERLFIRVSSVERDAIRELARAAGLSSNRWVASLIRAKLTGNPQLVPGEVEALSRSTAALGALGRNLNQIAKALNTYSGSLPAYRLNVLKALEVEITETRTVIRALLAANLERWKA